MKKNIKHHIKIMKKERRYDTFSSLLRDKGYFDQLKYEQILKSLKYIEKYYKNKQFISKNILNGIEGIELGFGSVLETTIHSNLTKGDRVYIKTKYDKIKKIIDKIIPKINNDFYIDTSLKSKEFKKIVQNLKYIYEKGLNNQILNGNFYINDYIKFYEFFKEFSIYGKGKNDTNKFVYIYTKKIVLNFNKYYEINNLDDKYKLRNNIPYRFYNITDYFIDSMICNQEIDDYFEIYIKDYLLNYN